VGVIVAPRGRLLMVLRFTIAHGKIIEIEAVAAPERLRQLDLAVLQRLIEGYPPPGRPKEKRPG